MSAAASTAMGWPLGGVGHRWRPRSSDFRISVDYGGWQWPLIEWAYGIAKPTGYADEHITHYTRDKLFDRIGALGLSIEEHEYILGGEIIIKARKPVAMAGAIRRDAAVV